MQQKKRTRERNASATRNYAQIFILLPDALNTPETVSQMLGLMPTATTTRGTPIHKQTSKGQARHQTLTKSSWVLSTHSLRLPNDCQAHVDWLLAQLAGKEDSIRQLQAAGCWVGVTCFWYTEHGKPIITTQTKAYLDDLHVTLDFELERE